MLFYFYSRAGLGLVLGKFWGVSVPLPPCSRARRSPSTLLGGRGLVVATHRVVMVTLQLGSCAQGCHGCPTCSALVLEAPLSFQAPSPSSPIVDEFKCG